MAKTSVKPKSKALYDELRDHGLKKKKAAKVANAFVVTKRGDTSGSPKRRSSASKSKPTSKSKATSKKRSTTKRAKSKR